MGRHAAGLALIACAVAVAGNASAATSTGNLGVSATVATNCVLTVATLNFGTYRPGNGNRNANGAIRVRCTNGLAYTVSLGTGLAPAATDTNRGMQRGAALLSYQLFKNAARTQNWGQTLVADRMAGTGNGLGTDNLMRVFGRIPDSGSNLLAVAGVYTDTVMVTVTY
jgi:spore coat protein U-like protein